MCLYHVFVFLGGIDVLILYPPPVGILMPWARRNHRDRCDRPHLAQVACSNVIHKYILSNSQLTTFFYFLSVVLYKMTTRFVENVTWLVGHRMWRTRRFRCSPETHSPFSRTLPSSADNECPPPPDTLPPSLPPSLLPVHPVPPSFSLVLPIHAIVVDAGVM